jgi:hypothetical protein
MGLLRQACDLESPTDGPGLVLLAADGAAAGMNEAAERWLEELGGQPDGSDLPIEISALATRLRHFKDLEPALPRLRVRTSSGRWAVLHASWLTAHAADTIAVIVEEAAPAEVAPLIMTAYGLTGREQTIAALVRQGLPTRQIASQLHLDHRHRAGSSQVRGRQDRCAQPRRARRHHPATGLPAPRDRR